MTTVYADLVLDTGELVRIECPGQFEDELYDSLNQCMKRKDEWSPARFEGCNAEFMGHSLSRVNMARVVGML
jgi:hypothetical protein